MSCLLVLMDVRPAPVDVDSGASLILLLVIILVLAVAFVAGLVFLLIWLKRRQMKDADESKPAERATA